MPEPDFVIKGNPMIKKNGRPIHVNRHSGRAFIGKSKRLADAEKDALAQIQAQCGDISEPLPITYPVHVMFLFYRGDRRACDLSNLYEFPQDILQEAGILENDALILSHDGSRKRYDKKNPRTEIYVSRCNEDGTVIPTQKPVEEGSM